MEKSILTLSLVFFSIFVSGTLYAQRSDLSKPGVETGGGENDSAVTGKEKGHDLPNTVLKTHSTVLEKKKMSFIPAGEFLMGFNCSDPENVVCSLNERPVHKVYLDSYFIDKYEVTIKEYAECVKAGKCSKPDTKEFYCEYYSNWKKPNRENYPVNCVDYYQAKAFCKWKGKRLPTEAEWEKAVRGGTETRWSFEYKKHDEYAWWEGNSGYDTHPVGSKKPNQFGLYDMYGNVSEWCSDWYDEKYYFVISKLGLVKNPEGPDTGSSHVVRGGSFSEPDIVSSSFRYAFEPASREYYIGFRCASLP